ncbi:hypothetical protein CL633_03820 [bacterium]|nr:hypothetical protein [bacterium]|tara:strand:- start:11529 stop:11924 length:396 start_codon:yes stop_codon:yes gene_type:complete
MMKFKKILSSKLYIFSCLMILFFLVFSIINDKYKNESVQEKFFEMQAEIKRLEKEKNSLLDQQNYLGTDVYFEREARGKLSLQKPGEEVFFIKSLEKNELVHTNNLENQVESKINNSEFFNFIKWFKYFLE